MTAERTTPDSGARPPLGPTLRLFARAIGEPVLRQLLPIYVGIGMVAAVVFGPTGMTAADVTGAAADSAGFRLGLWALWLTALAPATRSLVTAPAGFYLRALPIPRGHHYLLVGGALAVAQLPWGWLWLRGAGPGPAAAAVTVALAILCAQAIRPRSGGERLLALGGIAAGLGAVGVGAAWPILLALGLAGSALALPAAWRRAPEIAAPGPGAPVRGPAGLALAVALLALIWRRRGAALVRALLVTALGAAVAVLAARANQVTPAGLETLSLAIAALSSILIAGGCAGAALEAERDSRWLLDTTGTGGATRVAATTLAVAAIAGGFAALHGVGVAWGADAGALAPRLAGGAAAQAIGLAAIAVALARWVERPSGIDGTLVVSGLVLVLLGVVIAVAVLGEPALWGIDGLALFAALSSVGVAARPGVRRGRRRRGFGSPLG